MKILVTESQYQVIKEYFNPIQYIQYLMDKELDSDTNFESFQWMMAFQKYVDLIFKYTKKQTDMDNLSGMKVNSIKRAPWGTNFNDSNSKGQRLDWTLYLRPMLDGTVDHSEYEKMKGQYEVFKEVFSDTARQMGLTIIPAVEDKDVKDAKIDFKFYEINPQEMENYYKLREGKDTDNKKDDTAKWITCKNCNKKFTQTIHKGKKSLPICPTCGTHNKDKKEEQKESELTERCWKGYTQKGMKTMFGKRYPNCVKKKG